MIHHISIAAQQPLQVATVLAAISQGQVAPFPAHEGSYLALSFDPHGTMIEVLPEAVTLTPGVEAEGARFSTPNSSTLSYNPFHAAISVPTSEAEIHAMAQQAGWRVVSCNRLDYFHVVEVWVENRQLLEFLPPEFTAEYLASSQPEALQQLLVV
jgi:hypothetical protein